MHRKCRMLTSFGLLASNDDVMDNLMSYVRSIDPFPLAITVHLARFLTTELIQCDILASYKKPNVLSCLSIYTPTQECSYHSNIVTCAS